MNSDFLLCKEHILSEEYVDIQLTSPMTFDSATCIQPINEQYSIAYVPKSSFNRLDYSYSNFPLPFGLMDALALESSGIIKTFNQPTLGLTGKGVLIGFIDTGIDYLHPSFLNNDGTTRIHSIWDQSIQTGIPPEGFLYGSEYTREEINEAIWSENPRQLVPSIDENGHGTYIAGVAAGRNGAAPDAILSIVKLKPAKKFFKDYYLIKDDSIVYQENDIMTGVNYLIRLQAKLNLPLVICIGLGSNMGSHTGCCFLQAYLESLGKSYQTAVVIAAGNEANASHHFEGKIENVGDYEDVEILVGEDEQQLGFVTELWSDLPQIYTVGFTSPTGEVIEPLTMVSGRNYQLNFILDDTKIDLFYDLINDSGGSQVIRMRFITPNQGLWKIRVYNLYQIGGIYDLWLPNRGFISDETRFLEPDSFTTITTPSNSASVITVAAYNHRTNSIFIDSGRGNSRRGLIKPTLSAPGVNILGPLANSTSYQTRTGTSASAAIVAGAVCSLFEWAITKDNLPTITGTLIQFYLIAGVRTNPLLSYPNRDWGYGTLDLYHIFEVLRTLPIVN
ncbi:Ser-type protease [Lachnospiraceae bacterium TWA4]|nr:Ser-type protease [Lachnospiraceae bacterium TWA4]